MNWIYTARSRFSPETQPDRWKSYQDFSGFYHIEELVSADSMLCANLITEILDQDWNHNVQADGRVSWFTNSDYLQHRINFNDQQHNILAMFEHPTTADLSVPTNFEICGFDILDSGDSISVLTNCGQFPDIFAPQEINKFGLLSDLGRANAIAQAMRLSFPTEYHFQDCRVWQIARKQHQP